MNRNTASVILQAGEPRAVFESVHGIREILELTTRQAWDSSRISLLTPDAREALLPGDEFTFRGWAYRVEGQQAVPLEYLGLITLNLHLAVQLNIPEGAVGTVRRSLAFIPQASLSRRQELSLSSTVNLTLAPKLGQVMDALLQTQRRQLQHLERELLLLGVYVGRPTCQVSMGRPSSDFSTDQPEQPHPE